MATISNVSSATGAINFTGLASGIDTSSIIDGLTALNNQRIQLLQAQKSGIQQQQTTFSDLKAKLLALQAQTANLARSLAGPLDARQAVSSNTDVLTAAASSSAASGTYSFTVTSIAQANQILSDGLADPGTNIKQGTLTLQVGSGSAITATIDATNNTLQGLADAINAANGDVRATVINDGSALPYRLLLSTSKTGAANAIQVTNNLTTGTGADINPGATTVQAASDAQIVIGSGAGAVTVSSATNHFDNLISGVTIQVHQADPAHPVTLTVGTDSTAAGDAVQGFVDAYNGIIDFIDQQDNFDPVTKQAGILLGNRDANNLRRDIGAVLTQAVGGINPKANRLSTIGITFTDSGDLQFDRTKFEAAYTGQVAGVSADDIKRLFALTGASTNPGVRFLLGGTKTQATSGAPYQIDVTQAATKASITATNPLAASIVIDSTNNTFDVRVNNRTSSQMTLAAGTYTPSALAAAIQAAINANSDLAGSQVVVDLDAGNFASRRSFSAAIRRSRSAAERQSIPACSASREPSPPRA